jgi:chemotaxis methyl-accepting protein methylase
MMSSNKEITDLLLRSHGVDISKYEDTFLDKSIQKRMTETDCGSLEDYCSFLEQDKSEGKLFLSSLHVSYSEFFRNPLTFAVLERIVFPGMLGCQEGGRIGESANRSIGESEYGSAGVQEKPHTHPLTRKRELRIWSAACASGQEPYSLAILLEELKSLDSDNIGYRIFATDQDEAQINEARRGIYPAEALSNMNLRRLNRWFSENGDTYAVKPELKGNIDFSFFDLFSEDLSSPPGSIFGDFDLVICANLLFYYKKEYRKIILEKTGNSLASGGFLVAGETEREILMNYGYREVFPQSAVFTLRNAAILAASMGEQFT